jgi:hypothetical protein
MQRRLFEIQGLGNFEIPPIAMWGIFGIFFLIFATISAVLIYHWRRYGMRNRSIVLAEVVYLSVSALIIIGAITSLIAY